ncbi:MAG TPA: transcriptional repressor LexA [Ktedonobacterales bacterium]
MADDLSSLQAEIYHYIQEYIRTEGRPPTNREIGERVNILSTGHIDYHLSVLAKKGYITRVRNKSRGIRVNGMQPSGLPIAGTIAAGQPLDINSDSQQEVLDLSKHTRGYVLRVKGHSMIEDHIADGDLVLIDPDCGYGDGDIVVALCTTANGEAGAATLKRIYRERERIRLQPANSTMKPIYVPKDEWEREWKVQGKVMAVYRQC